MRILVAEDERNLNRILTEALTDEGYSVDPCFDGQEAWDALACAEYDVLVLDIMMPRMDGLTLVRKLRESGSTTPVLFLTSRDSVEDKVEGLETGADYYLVKPFHMQELLAVVRVMARKYTDTRTNVYTIADLSVDVSAHTVVRAGRVIELTSREYALLEYMIRNKGVVLSRERIENNLWNYDYEGGTPDFPKNSSIPCGARAGCCGRIEYVGKVADGALVHADDAPARGRYAHVRAGNERLGDREPDVAGRQGSLQARRRY